MEASGCPFLRAALAAGVAVPSHPYHHGGSLPLKVDTMSTISSSSSLASSTSMADLSMLESDTTHSTSSSGGGGDGSATSTSSSTSGSASSTGRPSGGTLPAHTAPPAAGVHQAWRPRRPDADAAGLKLTRRQLRKLGRSWSLAEVARHNSAYDAWIAVNGRVSAVARAGVLWGGASAMGVR